MEYLESTGTQYIDTGVIFTPQYKVIADIEFRRVSTSSADAQHNGFVKATDSGNYRSIIGFNNGRIQIYVANLNQNTLDGLLDRHTYIIDLPDKFTSIDNNRAMIIDTFTGSFTHSFFVFARNNAGVAELFCYERLYSIQFYDGSVIVRDFTPVIDWNDEPCMYDKVNNTNFYNAGTGRFLTNEDA